MNMDWTKYNTALDLLHQYSNGPRGTDGAELDEGLRLLEEFAAECYRPGLTVQSGVTGLMALDRIADQLDKLGPLLNLIPRVLPILEEELAADEERMAREAAADG